MNRIANSADATISHYIKSASEDRALRKCPVDIFSKVPGSVAGRVAMGIYKEHRGTDDTLKLVEHAIYGSSRLGLNTTIVDLSDGAEDNDPVVALDYGTRQYELSDHLGNVSVVLSGTRLPNTGNTNFTADVLSANEYYPFGMIMPNRNFSSESYRYGFNGMEKDEEFTNSSSHYDFGARIYDGRIGRWLAVDQMMSDYPMDSPFIFGGNSPIFMVDIKGYYKFKFYTRKFAPFESFGGGFEGDDRGFSSNPKQSARVTSYFSLDAETGDFDSYGYSSKSSHPAMPWSNKYQDPIVAFPRIDEGSVEEYNSGWFNV